MTSRPPLNRYRPRPRPIPAVYRAAYIPTAGRCHKILTTHLDAHLPDDELRQAALPAMEEWNKVMALIGKPELTPDQIVIGTNREAGW